MCQGACNVCHNTKKPVLATNTTTGQQLRFESIYQAGTILVTNGQPQTTRKRIGDALAGRAKTAYGYTWKIIVDKN